MKKATLSSLTYSQAMEEIEEIVERLETGDVQVDELLESVNRASDLLALCRDRLRATETGLTTALTRLDAESESKAIIATG